MSLSPHLGSLLSDSAARHAQRPAVEDLQGRSLSYQQLEEASDNLRSILKKHQLQAGCRIGILSPKNIAYVVSIFGILKSGAAYVPMDANAPMSRLAAICSDCQMQALIIDPALVDAFVLEHRIAGTQVTGLSNGLSLLLFGGLKPTHSKDLAYLIYTSGSTGVPKGVMHTHASALAFIDWSIGTFNAGPADRVASHAPFHFDLSIFDLFATLAAGGTLVLMDDKTAGNSLMLAEALAQKHISILYATPSTLSYLQLYGKMHKHDYSSLRLVLFAGEVFPIERLKALKAVLPENTAYYNLYGPTETNVCTYFQVPQHIPGTQLKPFPIGAPCSFARARIEQGELWIAGASLMAGYWNDEQKTAASFEKVGGDTWYKTGDLVEPDANGQLVYGGRTDRMVKRKGYRIELGEIEHVLLLHPAIAEAAVTARRESDNGEMLITAHLVTNNDQMLDEMALRSWCHGALPGYMAPDRFVFHRELPKTSTHKIDYKALTLLRD